MVLVYKNLQNWVILDKGKCWDSYSSAMVRIWDTKNISRNLCICQVHIAGIFGYYTMEIPSCKLVYKFDIFPQSPNQPDSECFDELNQQTAIKRKNYKSIFF